MKTLVATLMTLFAAVSTHAHGRTWVYTVTVDGGERLPTIAGYYISVENKSGDCAEEIKKFTRGRGVFVMKPMWTDDHSSWHREDKNCNVAGDVYGQVAELSRQVQYSGGDFDYSRVSDLGYVGEYFADEIAKVKKENPGAIVRLMGMSNKLAPSNRTREFANLTFAIDYGFVPKSIRYEVTADAKAIDSVVEIDKTFLRKIYKDIQFIGPENVPGKCEDAWLKPAQCKRFGYIVNHFER